MGSSRQAVCTSSKFTLQVLFFALLFAVSAAAANPTFKLKTIPVAGGLAIDRLLTADLDQDGIPDLAGATSTGIAVFFGDGQGNFSRVDLPIGSAGSLQIADFDGDGRPDIAVASGHQVAIFLNSGNRNFRALPPYTIPGWNGGDFGAADFNGDGKADLVLSLGSLDVSVLIGNGDGTFQSPHSIYTAVPPDPVEPLSVMGPFLTGDFNGDHRADVTLAEFPLSFTFGGANIVTLINQGSLTFTATHFSTGNYQGPSVLDANGDHIDDIGFGWEACHTPCAGAEVWTGAPSGTMARLLSFDTDPTLQSTAMYPLAADFNGDGMPDVAFSMASNSGFTFPPVAAHQSVLMFLGPITPGQSPAPTPVDFNLGSAPSSGFNNAAMVTADFNLDGKPDIAVITEAHDAIILMLNTTSGGTFPAPPRDFAFSITPASATVNAGQPADLTAAVSRFGAFSDSVTFACSGLPSGAACSFSPASVTPAVNAAAASAVTITTTARSSAALMRHSTGVLALFLPLFAIAFAGIGSAARSTSRIAALILVALLLIALVACGGNAKPAATSTPPTTSAPTPPTPPTPPPASTGTPAGTYTVTVTATSGGTTPITHSQTFTLVVQ